MKRTLDIGAVLPASLRSGARRVLGLEALERIHASMPESLGAPEFAMAALERLGVRVEASAVSLAAIPATGPLVLVCNHPFGGLDGLITLARIGAIRPDLRLLANPELARIPQLRSAVIPTDPYGGARAAARNAMAARRALRWVTNGGALVIFPAGEVARFDPRKLAVCDALWSVGAARLVRLSGAPVVPLHISGCNGLLFLAASLVHRRLGTWLLPRELLRRRRSSVRLSVGEPITVERLANFRLPEDLAAYLRLSSELLAREIPGRMAARAAGVSPVQAARADSALSREIGALPPERVLARSPSLTAYCARAAEIPNVMQEIGRLRELSFRAVGEGTGRDVDLDLFDNYYDQLFLWDHGRGQIAGGYRLGRVDEIVRRYGKRGLYTSTLFEYRDPLVALLGPTIELGRSFVHPDHQRSFAPLLLLWRGIGEYVGRHPRYCRLLGPVSISNDYHAVSKELLVDYLRSACLDPLLASLVKARTPFDGRRTLRDLGPNADLIGGLEGLSSMVADLESDARGVPVLLRQYLKLGGRILGFNVDRDFGDALDCLLLVDLRDTEPRALAKYLSPEALARFTRLHGGRRRAWRARRTGTSPIG